MTYPNQIEAEDFETLVAKFGPIGEQVGPRKGPNRRTAEDRDWWCFRRWMMTMGAERQLNFGLRVSRLSAGGPDFLINFTNVSGILGLEITEATNREDSIERTKSENATGGPWFIGDFGGRKYTHTSREELEADYLDQISAAIERKVRKSSEYFKNCDVLELLIYVNNNAGTFVSLGDVADRLVSISQDIIVKAAISHRFGRIAIIDDQGCCQSNANRSPASRGVGVLIQSKVGAIRRGRRFSSI